MIKLIQEREKGEKEGDYIGDEKMEKVAMLMTNR